MNLTTAIEEGLDMESMVTLHFKETDEMYFCRVLVRNESLRYPRLWDFVRFEMQYAIAELIDGLAYIGPDAEWCCYTYFPHRYGGYDLVPSWDGDL